MQKQVEYERAGKTKYPAPIVFVIAKDANGKANPMTVGWTTNVSSSPPMKAVALVPKRYTAAAIRHSKCFTIVYPAADMQAEALFFGTKKGSEIDKLAATECKTEPAAKIDSVILTDATANFECELETEIPIGDHILFVGKVVASHVNTEPTKRLYSVEAGGKMGPVL
ncbi:MAG: flavin reductase family protein [Planctomycetota bacterium]|jgi:flavin reductase (DIM6/NTAB) family NADH-FMN oxidoreductase RutF